jgi:FixJ family two-component response regulator
VSSAVTVALVDDDVSVLRAVQRILADAGFAVETFASAEAFLAAAPWAGTACLVLDVELRGLSGLDLVQRVRATGVTIPVIFITAHDDPATRERLERAKPAACFVKPLDGPSLVAAVHHVAS